MGQNSKIEWTDKTWNPVTGCTKVSQGCKNCYAERWSNRFGSDFTNVQEQPGRLLQPLEWKKPSMVFVNSMSDLFHEKVSFEFLDAVFSTMSNCEHIFQILTKRPERMVDFFQWKRDRHGIIWGPPDNVWIGVSVEDQKTADERIPYLINLPVKVKFLSCEPLLGPIDFTPPQFRTDGPVKWNQNEWLQDLDWIIVGGESGPGARPMHPDWARQIRDACWTRTDASRPWPLPFFFKQWGEWVDDKNSPGEVREFIIRYWKETPANGITVDGLKMYKVGKHRSGALLDGKEWKQFPRLTYEQKLIFGER
jgi:protein gp37